MDLHLQEKVAIVSENIASAAEELAVQAEQLRQAMAFFRIAETLYHPGEGDASSPCAIVSRSEIDSAARTEEAHERCPHQADDVETTQNPIGSNKPSQGEEYGDDEFEHY
jgi:hypothetical protein